MKAGDLFFTTENNLYCLYKVLLTEGDVVYVRAYWPVVLQPTIETLSTAELRTSCEALNNSVIMSAVHIENIPVTAEETQGYKAFKHIQQGIQNRGNTLAALLSEADVAANNGNFSAAVHLYTEAASFSRNLFTLFDKRGHCLLQLERYGEAIADLEHSLSIFPEGKDSLYHCTLAYYHSGKQAQAIEKLEQLIDLEETYPGAKELLETLHSKR